MRSPYRRLAALARLATITLVAMAVATPASAQFGGLKKKIKAKAVQEAVSEASPETAVPDDQDGEVGATTGQAGTAAANPAAPDREPEAGMIVLTKDVVGRLLAGLRAGKTVRDSAANEDTAHGRYNKAKAAYAMAKPKCEAAQLAFYQRAATNDKMLVKYNALNDKMIEAQNKGDTKLVAVYQDSALALQDPSCIVKEPSQIPNGYYVAERALETRAENQEMKASDFTRNELAVIKERTISILQGDTPPGGASAGEKSAVLAKKAELKPLLGVRDKPPAQAAKPAPAAASSSTPAPVQSSPDMSAATASMSDCMVKNTLKHEARLEALGKRAEAAEEANDTAKLMAIADTMQRIQMAGCRSR